MCAETLDVSDFENKQLNPWDGTRAYAKDKRRQVALAEHLAQLWHPQGVDVYSMHPGWADTEGVRTSMPGFHKAFKNTLRDAKEGSDTIVWLALQVCVWLLLTWKKRGIYVCLCAVCVLCNTLCRHTDVSMDEAITPH